MHAFIHTYIHTCTLKTRKTSQPMVCIQTVSSRLVVVITLSGYNRPRVLLSLFKNLKFLKHKTYIYISDKSYQRMQHAHTLTYTYTHTHSHTHTHTQYTQVRLLQQQLAATAAATNNQAPPTNNQTQGGQSVGQSSAPSGMDSFDGLIRSLLTLF